MSFNKYAILILIITSVFSCRKDNYKDEIISTQDKIGTVTTNISGIITDVDGDPISDVIINLHQKTVTTNEHGVFLFKQITLNNSGSRLEVKKNNYFNSYRIVYPNKPKEISFVNIKLVAKGDAEEFNTSEGGIIKFNDGAEVSFSPNSIKYANGTNYSGMVSVYSHWYNPVKMDLGLVAPADLVGKDKNGEKVVLYSYGMMAVELYGSGGEKLQLADGEKAKITFPIPSEILDDAPTSIPLWSVDENTGLWIEEAIAQLSEGKYIGEVSHFSFWNCDAPTTFVNIQGYLKLADGTALANYPIYIKRDNIYGAYGYTNNLGFFKGLVPNGEMLTLTVSHCSVLLIEQPIGPYSTDVDLGDFTVELTDYATTLSGTLKGCIGEPLNYAYGLTNTRLYISPDINGNISTIISGCGDLDLQVTFYDGNGLNKTDDISIDKNLDNNDLGDVVICNQVEDYIRFNLDGGINHLIPDPNLYVINDEKIRVLGMVSGSAIQFSLDIPSVNVGVVQAKKTFVNTPSSHGSNGVYLKCDEELEDFPCDQFSVELLSVDLVSNIVTGTFSGYLTARKDSFPDTGDSYFVEGSFRSSKVELYNEASVSGKIWIDLNNNGTRDVDEEDKTIKNRFIILNNLDTNGNHFWNSNDGSYNFEHVKPGRYKVSAALQSYELTTFQSGDPDQDNDFLPSLNNYYNVITEELEILDDQVLENIDIGLKKPVTMTCNVSASGCKPDFKIAFSFNGGLMPYTVTLSNGMSQILNDELWGSFIVADGGNYTLTITDALGNTVSKEVSVIENRNVVQGLVWLDKDGGTPNLYDNNDENLKNITVTLRNEDGSKLASMGSNKYGYKFVFVPEGTYYVEVQSISDHSLLEKRSENSGSKINIDTYKSDVFTFSSCREYKYLNIGFKKD